MGFECFNIPKNNVSNLWAIKGCKAPLIVFAGHTDVVPPGNIKEWFSDPFTPTQYQGYIYGRGAADMKGSIAAFVTALEEFLKSNPKHRGSLAVLLTSDEEGPSIDGTLEVCKQLTDWNIRPNYCIIGEPTSCQLFGDTCKNGRRGSLSGNLIVHGIQGHVAYPHLARNPLHQFAPALSELVSKKWDYGNSDFPETTFQISNFFSGSGANNVIPGSLKIKFNFRFSTESNEKQLKNKVHKILDRHNLKYDIEWKLEGDPYLTRVAYLSNKFVDAIQIETGIKSMLSTSGGTSDGRFLSKICDEVIEFGPDNSTIHKANERIKLSDLESLKNIYRRVIESVL